MGNPTRTPAELAKEVHRQSQALREGSDAVAEDAGAVEQNSSMANLGLFKGFPKQVLSKEAALAQFDKNQGRLPSTRPALYDHVRMLSQQPSEKSTPKKPG